MALLKFLLGMFAAAEVQKSRFDRALDFYLENEGGDVDHADDPGGATSRGLASVYNPELGDVTALSDDQVMRHYRKKYWHKVFDRLASDRVAIKVFDISTNAGFDDGSKVIQRAINQCGGRIAVDGVMGSRTVAAANSLNEEALISAICSNQWWMYCAKMEEDQRKIAFSAGWKRRAWRVPQ